VELLAPNRVTLVEEVHVTQDPPMKRHMMVAGAGMGTFLLALCAVSWLEHRKRRITSIQDIPDQLGIPLLGTVPPLPGRGDSPSAQGARNRSAAYSNQRAKMLDCVDRIRTRLIHTTNEEGLRVLMVTSAVPREGKTSLASNLAMSLARAGHRTLLVDGDLRLPAIHRAIEVTPGPGLAEVVRGEDSPFNDIQPTGVERLWVLPAGRTDLTAVESLARHEQLQALIVSLREQYDYVIVDSAPVLPVLDGLLIAQHVDGVVLSMLRGVSQVPAVSAAFEKLKELDIRVVGTVLNGADLSSLYDTWDGRGYAKIYETTTAANSPEAEASEETDHGTGNEG
jgi:capsular exopolysaccharide synthesis family protein